MMTMMTMMTTMPMMMMTTSSLCRFGLTSAWDGTDWTPQRPPRGRLLDRVLLELARAAGMEIGVRCEGDTHIDDHHTAEDVAITLGQCLHEALGDKAGLARMGCAEGAHDAAR